MNCTWSSIIITKCCWHLFMRTLSGEGNLYSSGTSDTFLTAWITDCVCSFTFMSVLPSCQCVDQIKVETKFCYNEIQVVIYLCDSKLQAFRHYFGDMFYKKLSFCLQVISLWRLSESVPHLHSYFYLMIAFLRDLFFTYTLTCTFSELLIAQSTQLFTSSWITWLQYLG
jgi:hypothetical protein